MDMDDQELLQQSMQQGLNGEEAQEHSDLNLRPKTMFDVKGRARPSETANDNYLPQWSKDGEGFKKQYSLAEDRDRRKNKVVIRYSREELLAMHVVSSGPPECPEGTPVLALDSLPPVANIPFDYDEIYKQWAANKERTRQPGRGRGQPRADGNTSGATPSTANRTNSSTANAAGGRVGGNDANNRHTSEDLNDASSGRKWNDKRTGGEDSWERGARIVPSPNGGNDKDDLWDDVDPSGGEFKDMGLSNFAEAAELFRREMDEMHRAGGARAELRQQPTMESEDQFADSVEEEDEPPMWDMPASEPVAADLSSWSTFNDHQPPPHVTPVPVDAWFYLDPQGLQQGPFKSAEMREWFEAGYFKPHLPIRFGLEGDFASLANHFRHGQIPFSTVPSPTTTPGANHQQQLLLQKQQQQLLEQQQFLANQLQQQRVLEQRRAQEDQQRRALQEQQRVRLEMQQRIQLQEQAGRALQQQQQQQQQFHYQRPQAILPGAAAIGSGWGRPRDNIVPGAGDSMMGGLGMYAAGPPTQAPKPVTTEYAAPSWDEDTTGSSLWNSSVKNDPELLGGAWDKPADEEPSAAASWGGADSSGWSKEKQQQPTTPVVSWNKPQESDGWGGPEPAAPQASPKSSWSKPDVVPQLGSWGRQTSEADVPDVVKEADSTWEATTPNTPSLKQIQQEEQESMRRRLKPSSSSSSSSSSSQQPPPSPTPDQQPHLEDMGQQLKRMLGVSNPSPSKSWGSKTAAAAATPPAPVTRSLSLREIQAEEERLAQLKRQEKPVVSSSRWSSVVTGMPPPYSSARPAPVEVKATPPKDRDASFWNFDASAATAASPSSHTPAYNNGSDDLVAWSSKQVKKLGGTEDLTLIQYCATLEDPGEIREYLAAYLGSTPKVSAFATEFIQKKKKHVAGKKQSAADAKAASQQKKKLHH